MSYVSVPDAPELIEDLAPRPAHRYPRPDYTERFRCLAEACDENCCSGWSIPIDQRTFANYLKHPTLKPFAESLIVINTDHPSPGDVARMPLTHTGTCAFLNQDKLCGIHAHFGPAMLSNACASYPREYSASVDPVEPPEAALNLSCPEAARLTLLDSNLLGHGPWEIFGPRRYAHLDDLRRCLPANFHPVLAVREFALLLLTDPTYLLWQRLHRMGELAQAIETLSAGTPARQWVLEHPGAVALLLAEQARCVAHHRIGFKPFEPHPTLQLAFTAEVLRTRLAEPPVPERFLKSVHDFQAGLGCDEPQRKRLSDKQLAQRYSRAYSHFFRPLFDRHPHLIENYIANHIFKYAYPLGRKTEDSPVSQHASLCLQVALLQTLLIGAAAHHRQSYSPLHVVGLIQGFAKTIEHRRRSVDHLLSLAQARNLSSLSGLALLLRVDHRSR